MSRSNMLKLKQNYLKSNRQNTEVDTQQLKRHYSTSFKLKVLEQASNCKALGELGAMLRRTGVSSTSLHRWRMAQASGELNVKTPDHSQRSYASKRSQTNKLIRLERENNKLKAIIELQKKISEFIADFQEQSNEVSLCN